MAISMPKKADVTITIINYHVYSFGVQYAEAEVGWNAYLVTFICHVFIYAFGGPFFFLGKENSKYMSLYMVEKLFERAI